MGRTNPTYRMQVESTADRWQAYRRGLRAPDKPHFDRLFGHARTHADAGGHVNATDPMVPILVSMLLAHERELVRLSQRLADRDGPDGGDGDPDPATGAAPGADTVAGGVPAYDTADTTPRHRP